MDTQAGLAVQLAEDLSPEDVRAVLEVFRADIKSLRERLQAAMALADEASLRRTAHSIAGAAGAVGALRLEQAARLAMAPATVSADELPAQCEVVVRLVGQTLAELDSVVAKLAF